MSDTCIICENSKTRGDKLHLNWQGLNCPIKVHISCRKNYVRPSSIQKEKRKNENIGDNTQENPAKLRSKNVNFNIKEDCPYCCKRIIYDKNNQKQTASSSVETLEYLENVLKKADERGDEWASDVKLRIQLSSDLVAAEGKYHRCCAQRFYSGRYLPNENTS